MKFIKAAGRIIGFAGSLGSGSLWLYFLAMLRLQHDLEVGRYLLSSLMIFLSLTGIYASWRGVPSVMFAVFLGSFFPLGLYMLGNPSWVKWIGVFNLLYLASAILLLIGARSTLLVSTSGTVREEPSAPAEKEGSHPGEWWLATTGSLAGLAACAYEAYRFSCPHLVHSPWEIPALGAYILFFGAALAGSWRRWREVVLAAGVLALGLTVLLFVTGLFSAFITPDYVFSLPGSLLILLGGLVRSGGAESTTSRSRPPRR